MPPSSLAHSTETQPRIPIVSSTSVRFTLVGPARRGIFRRQCDQGRLCHQPKLCCEGCCTSMGGLAYFTHCIMLEKSRKSMNSVGHDNVARRTPGQPLTKQTASLSPGNFQYFTLPGPHRDADTPLNPDHPHQGLSKDLSHHLRSLRAAHQNPCSVTDRCLKAELR